MPVKGCSFLGNTARCTGKVEPSPDNMRCVSTKAAFSSDNARRSPAKSGLCPGSVRRSSSSVSRCPGKAGPSLDNVRCSSTKVGLVQATCDVPRQRWDLPPGRLKIWGRIIVNPCISIILGDSLRDLRGIYVQIHWGRKKTGQGGKAGKGTFPFQLIALLRKPKNQGLTRLCEERGQTERNDRLHLNFKNVNDH